MHRFRLGDFIFRPAPNDNAENITNSFIVWYSGHPCRRWPPKLSKMRVVVGHRHVWVFEVYWGNGLKWGPCQSIQAQVVSGWEVYFLAFVYLPQSRAHPSQSRRSRSIMLDFLLKLYIVIRKPRNYKSWMRRQVSPNESKVDGRRTCGGCPIITRNNPGEKSSTGDAVTKGMVHRGDVNQNCM